MTMPSTLQNDDLIREQAYQIARGTRPLALVGSCALSADIEQRLRALAVPGAVPFVCERGHGVADFGYGVAPWAVDLYRWATQEPDNVVPPEQRHRIIGLLLGYSVQAVTEFETSAPSPRGATSSA